MPERKYRQIKIPAELHEKIKYLSETKGIAMWKIVAEAVALWENVRRRPEERARIPRFDKASWYVFKLANSIGALKENPTEDNVRRTMRTIEQIEERIGIDASLLKKAVEEYIKYKDTQHKIELNDMAKLTIGDILEKMLFR